MGLVVLGKTNSVKKPDAVTSVNPDTGSRVKKQVMTDLSEVSRVNASKIIVVSRQQVKEEKKQKNTEWRAEKPGKKSAFLQDMLSDNE